MIQKTILKFKELLERRELEQSAEFYAELFIEDAELQELTEAAIVEWPE